MSSHVCPHVQATGCSFFVFFSTTAWRSLRSVNVSYSLQHKPWPLTQTQPPIRTGGPRADAHTHTHTLSQTDWTRTPVHQSLTTVLMPLHPLFTSVHFRNHSNCCPTPPPDSPPPTQCVCVWLLCGGGVVPVCLLLVLVQDLHVPVCPSCGARRRLNNPAAAPPLLWRWLWVLDRRSPIPDPSYPAHPWAYGYPAAP